jgi:mRNA interferase MazF
VTRDDIFTAALPGDLGKPRPVVIVQSNILAESVRVLVAPLTTEIQELAFRPVVESSPRNGLRVRSQIMVDKLSAIRRERCGQRVGRLDPGSLATLDGALALVLGLGRE